MFLARTGSAARPSARWIALLSLLFLAGIAFTIPASSIRSETVRRRGALVGLGTLSDRLAELRAAEGYSFVAVDLSRAGLDADEPWRTHLDRVRMRQFPVWGWIRTDVGLGAAQAIVFGGKSADGRTHPPVPLDGLFVYGPDASRWASSLRWSDLHRRSVVPPIVPVVRNRDPRPAEGRYGVVLDEAGFPGSDIPVPVLLAARLDYAQVQRARAAAEGDYLIAFIGVD